MLLKRSFAHGGGGLLEGSGGGNTPLNLLILYTPLHIYVYYTIHNAVIIKTSFDLMTTVANPNWSLGSGSSFEGSGAIQGSGFRFDCDNRYGGGYQIRIYTI